MFQQFKPLLKALAAIKKMSAEKQFAGLTNTIAASAVELNKGIEYIVYNFYIFIYNISISIYVHIWYIRVTYYK